MIRLSRQNIVLCEIRRAEMWKYRVSTSPWLQSGTKDDKVLKLAFCNLHLAPISKDPLDLGTGTGIWAIDFAECVERFA